MVGGLLGLAVCFTLSTVVHIFACKWRIVVASTLQLVEQGPHVCACEASSPIHSPLYQSLQAMSSVSTKAMPYTVSCYIRTDILKGTGYLLTEVKDLMLIFVFRFFTVSCPTCLFADPALSWILSSDWLALCLICASMYYWPCCHILPLSLSPSIDRLLWHNSFTLKHRCSSYYHLGPTFCWCREIHSEHKTPVIHCIELFELFEPVHAIFISFPFFFC